MSELDNYLIEEAVPGIEAVSYTHLPLVVNFVPVNPVKLSGV